MATEDSRWHWLYSLGAVAALILCALFLIGMLGTLIVGPQPISATGWLIWIQDNWLVVLFKLNAGFSGVQPQTLTVLNLLDAVIMILFGVMSLGLVADLRHMHRAWSLIAAALPWLGLPVYLITATAGRSALLLSALILSAIMLPGSRFGKVSAWTGLAAGALLFFAGDLGTAIFSSSPVIAILIGIGYLLWMLWLGQVGRGLLELGRVEASRLARKS